MTVLKSKIDDSVNFITEMGPGEAIECRYVRRKPEYFVCYLSCQSACNRGCQFCHLTTTGQTKGRDLGPSAIYAQALEVIEYYKGQPEANIIHYNFMARGEPLANRYILENGGEIVYKLSKLAKDNRLVPKVNISTIMPFTLDQPLEKIFAGSYPTIYYSLYSMNPVFRSKWLPGAMDPNKALDMLKAYQDASGKIIKFHWAFIKGENDDEATVYGILRSIKDRGIVSSFNCVRYNPPNPLQSQESEKYAALTELISGHIDGKTKIIERVGFDCKASCGMFFNGEE
jgi:23S rRNA (adenine2503-C2)-methyltransferase